MKKRIILTTFYILLVAPIALLVGQAWAETIKLGITTDVHFEANVAPNNTYDDAIANLVAQANTDSADGIVVLGDVIHHNNDATQLAANIAGVSAAFAAATMPGYLAVGNHDSEGQTLAAYLAGNTSTCIAGQSCIPVETVPLGRTGNWTLDVGTNYRIITWYNASTVGGDWWATPDTLTFLEAALEAGRVAGKRLILIGHTKISEDYPGTPMQFIGTPVNKGGTASTSSLTGTATVTASTYTFTAAHIGWPIFIKHGGVWGFGNIVSVDGSTAVVTVDTAYPYQSLDATEDWTLAPGSVFSHNANAQRALVEAAKTAGADIALVLHGHSHVTHRAKVNDIEYVTFGNGYAGTPANTTYSILTVNDDSWSVNGYGTTRSWNTPFYVSPTGSDSNTGWGPGNSDAWLTIAKAVATVTYSDTVNVLAGTYAEGVALTTSGTATYPITWNFASGAIVDKGGVSGYTLTAASHTRVYGGTFKGGGISSLRTSGTSLTNFLISGATLTLSLFGAYLEDTSTAPDNLILGCTMSSNTNDGVVWVSSKFPVVSSIATGNGRYGFYTTGTASPNIYNNTVYGNLTTGIKLNYTTSPTVKNNITSGNTTYGIDAINTAAGCTIQYNNITDNSRMGSSTNSNNVTTNPLFVSVTDFHLQGASPAKAAGVTLSGSYTDFAGVRLPTPYGWPIGAYGYNSFGGGRGSFSGSVR